MKFPCRKSRVQEYDCQVFTTPRWKSSHKHIGFDMCLARELFYLWDLGIITTGCCCGHHARCEYAPGIFNEGDGSHSYIGVAEEFIPKMKRLGYEVRPNPNYPGSENEFIPKTIIT